MNKEVFEVLPTKDQTADEWFLSLCSDEDESRILKTDDGLFRRHLVCRLLGENRPKGPCIHCGHGFHEGKCLTVSVTPSGKNPPVHCECPGHGSPIDMILPCPSCGMLHIDAPEPDVCIHCGLEKHWHSGEFSSAMQRGTNRMVKVCDQFEEWTNPLHKSHLCHSCGIVWRPADVPTNGVAEIKTRGKEDTWNRFSLTNQRADSTDGQ